MSVEYDQNDVPLLLQAMLEGWPVSMDKKQDIVDTLHKIATNDENRPNTRVNACRGMIDAGRVNVDLARVMTSVEAIKRLSEPKKEPIHVQPGEVASELARLLAAPERGASAEDLERRTERPRLALDDAVEIDGEPG